MSDSAKVCGFLDLANNSSTKKTSLLCLHIHARYSIRSLCVVFCVLSLLKYSMSLLWRAGWLVSRCLANLLGTMAALANVSLQTRYRPTCIGLPTGESLCLFFLFADFDSDVCSCGSAFSLKTYPLPLPALLHLLSIRNNERSQRKNCC